MVATLLIANRGEIAVRIAATAGAMGLETVGVFTDSDAGAMHVDVVDRAVGLGKSPRGYLDGESIIAAAVNAGADAVHPGYGFLSEDPVFAAAVRRAELTYVGPSAKSIRLLGNKTQAKPLITELLNGRLSV